MVNPTHIYPPTTEPGPFNLNRYARVGLHERSDGAFVNASPGSPVPMSDFLYLSAVSSGAVTGTSSVFKFGFNPDINGVEETVWDHGGIYAYPAAAIQMSVSSSSVNDTAAGTGARTVFVAGLDANYNEISETVTLNGQTPVLTSALFLRINRASVVSAGSGETAAGDIYVGTGVVSAGVPATVYARIRLGDNQTLMAVWTVPSGYTGYILKGNIGTGTVHINQYIVARLVQRPFGGVFRTASKVTLQNGEIAFDFVFPVPFAEKTDIETRAFSSGMNNLVFADFFIIYVANS